MTAASPSLERPTLVGWLMRHRVTALLLSALPVPRWLIRGVLRRDNLRENRRDGWARLRDRDEEVRYAAVRSVTEKYAGEGLVVDVGCSQGILQEGLRYGRYVGVDSAEEPIRLASAKCDERTAFVCADGASYVPGEPPAAVVMNELLYYLDRPLDTIEHYERLLGAGGVLVISLYARTWSSRRLLRDIGRRLEVVECSLVTSGHLAWSVAAYRSRRQIPS